MLLDEKLFRLLRWLLLSLKKDILLDWKEAQQAAKEEVMKQQKSKNQNWLYLAHIYWSCKIINNPDVASIGGFNLSPHLNLSFLGRFNKYFGAKFLSLIECPEIKVTTFWPKQARLFVDDYIIIIIITTTGINFHIKRDGFIVNPIDGARFFN